MAIPYFSGEFFTLNAVALEFFVRHHFALLLTYIDYGHAVGTGVARVQGYR